jgi:hypothetical protein
MDKCSLDQFYNLFSLQASKSALAVFPSVCGHAIGHLLGVVILCRNHEIAADGALFHRAGLSKNAGNEDFGVAIQSHPFPNDLPPRIAATAGRGEQSPRASAAG